MGHPVVWGLERLGLEPGAEVCAELGVFEAEFDGSAEEALLVAGVVALADVAVSVDLLVLEKGFDGVGHL